MRNFAATSNITVTRVLYLARSYEILKVDKFRNNDSGGTTSPKSSHCDVIESNDSYENKPETSEVIGGENNTATTETKLERFTHLTDALLRADEDSNGKDFIQN